MGLPFYPVAFRCLVADVGNVSCRSLPAWNNAAAHSLDFGGSEKRISNFHSLSFSSLCPSVRPSVRPSCHHITDGLQRRRIHISSRRTGRTRTTKSRAEAADRFSSQASSGRTTLARSLTQKAFIIPPCSVPFSSLPLLHSHCSLPKNFFA